MSGAWAVGGGLLVGLGCGFFFLAQLHMSIVDRTFVDGLPVAIEHEDLGSVGGRERQSQFA